MLGTLTPSGQTAIFQTRRRRCQHLCLPVAQRGPPRIQVRVLDGRGCDSKSVFLHCVLFTAAGLGEAALTHFPQSFFPSSSSGVLAVPASPRGPTLLLASTHQAPQEASALHRTTPVFRRIIAWLLGHIGVNKCRSSRKRPTRFAQEYLDRDMLVCARVA